MTQEIKGHYIPWHCRCCDRRNTSADSCDCTQRGLRRDPMNLSSVRTCSACGKCSIHCPGNHTHLADGGWGYYATVEL
jgi:hypothetical protein